MLPYGVGYRVGRFFLDFEGDHDLYIDNDAIYGDYRVDGFQFTKTWNTFSAKAVIGRNTFSGAYKSPAYRINGAGDVVMNSGNLYDTAQMHYALDLTWQPNEKFFIGANGVWVKDDSDLAAMEDMDYNTYSVYASYNFTPAVALQGTYYWQDLDEGIAGGFEDSPKAWRATLAVKQDLLKFTGLRFEYQQQDNTFNGVRDPYSFGVNSANAASISDNMPWNDGTTKLFFIYADQKWNDKWSSYLRYQQADFDTTGLDDAKGYGAGVTYQYTPAIAFRLAYDCVDYGDGNIFNHGDDFKDGKDHVFQFRTAINF